MAETTNQAAPVETETPSDVAAQLSESADTIEEAQESVEELRERIQKLESKSTRSGREHAREVETLKKELASRDTALEKAIQDNRKWVQRELNRPDLDPEDRSRLLASLGQGEAAKASSSKAAIEAAHWRAIATEENPKMKAVLMKRAEQGKFLSAEAIEDLRDLMADDEEDDKPKKKEPPRVGVRTSGTVSKSVDSRIAEAKSAKDARGLWEAMVEKARNDAANRRG